MSDESYNGFESDASSSSDSGAEVRTIYMAGVDRSRGPNQSVLQEECDRHRPLRHWAAQHTPLVPWFASNGMDKGLLLIALECASSCRDTSRPSGLIPDVVLEHAAPLLMGDKEVVMAAIKGSYHSGFFALKHSSCELRADKEVAMAAVTQHGLALQYSSDELRADKQVVLAAVHANASAVHFALQLDTEICVACVTRNWDMLKHLPAAMRSNRDVVLAAIAKNGFAIQHASPKLQLDRQVALAALRKDFALQYHPTELKADKEFVLAAVVCGGCLQGALYYAAPVLKKDRDVVMAAVTHSDALSDADDVFKADREVVMAAVTFIGCAFKAASAELQGDKEIALLAIKGYPRMFSLASEELRGDKDVALLAVTADSDMLRYVSVPLKDDREIVLAAVVQDGRQLQYASDGLCADEEVVLAAVVQCVHALRYAADALRANKELIFAVLSKYGTNTLYDRADVHAARLTVPTLHFASPELQADASVQQLVSVVEHADTRQALADILQRQRCRVRHPTPTCTAAVTEALAVIMGTTLLRLRFWHWTLHRLRSTPAEHNCTHLFMMPLLQHSWPLRFKQAYRSN